MAGTSGEYKIPASISPELEKLVKPYEGADKCPLCGGLGAIEDPQAASDAPYRICGACEGSGRRTPKKAIGDDTVG